MQRAAHRAPAPGARGRRLGARGRGGLRRQAAPRHATSGRVTAGMSRGRRDWPLWEVFVRARRGLSHTHVGSLHAPDARDGAAQRPRRLHPPQRGRLDLGRARRRDHRVAARTRRTRSSTRPPTRSTGTRRSTTIPDEVRAPVTRPRPPLADATRCGLGDDALVLAQRLGEWIGPRARARGGRRARQHRARPARPGPLAADATPASSRAPAATRTTSPTCATSASSATCQLVEQPNGDFARHDRPPAALLDLPARAVRRGSRDSRRRRRSPAIAAKAVKEVAYHRDHADAVDAAARRRHRRSRHRRMQAGARRASGRTSTSCSSRRARPALAPAASPSTRRALRAGVGATTSTRCSPRRRSTLPETDAGAGAAAGAGVHTEHARATCSPRCSTCTARTRGRRGDATAATSP